MNSIFDIVTMPDPTLSSSCMHSGLPRPIHSISSDKAGGNTGVAWRGVGEMTASSP
jgi:hypothetical protein